jgi:hypothetical protein
MRKYPIEKLWMLEGGGEDSIVARNCEIPTAVDICFDIFFENSIRQNGRRSETKFTAEKFFRRLMDESRSREIISATKMLRLSLRIATSGFRLEGVTVKAENERNMENMCLAEQ